MLDLRFVKQMPEALEGNTLYVSIEHCTVMHLCCCGCGREVVTPLSPTDWQLYFDGESLSLTPSIGNWRFPCRSHYWIRRSRAEWCPSWDDSREEKPSSEPAESSDGVAESETIEPQEPSTPSNPSVWQQIWNWLRH
ncbi:DUF6527 family protein [Roseimicrobium gellanilyticum]|uniref:DUF6527 family protein n=1 Tax=Roseimicrobium gellanilyticum TaxID=748857 RepID=UPI000DEA811B